MKDWNEKVKAAHDMVSALCLPRGSKGSREWIMSIPARPDHDPDLIITSGLMAAKKEIKALIAERDEWKRRCEAIKAHVGFAAEAECCCEYDSNEDRIVHCAWCVAAGNIIAIAEGRDNG